MKDRKDLQIEAIKEIVELKNIAYNELTRNVSSRDVNHYEKLALDIALKLYSEILI